MLEHRNCTRAQLVALFRAAEVCLITSLNDGMNLIAKEYVTARGEESGSLVLSRFTGASEYLKTARIIDPMNQAESALALMQELTGVHSAQRDENWGRMLKVVRNYKSVDWMQSFVSDLVEARQNRILYGVRPGAPSMSGL
jgi:trehalose 6-phosphate synthase